MGTVDHLNTLRREGALLAAAADEVGLSAPVPTCPDWTIRDLLWHTGVVHRWTKTVVVESRRRPPDDSEIAPIAGPIPDDALLVEWYRESHHQLTRALESADPDLDCWQLIPAATPVASWTRRQAHETCIHRVDAESARGDEVSPIGEEFAVDGLDELLIGYHSRQSSLVRSSTPKLLYLRATDDPPGRADWFLHITDDPLDVAESAAAEVDCTLSGPAELLYLAMWNRCRIDDLAVEGDSGVVKLWQDLSAIRWA